MPRRVHLPVLLDRRTLLRGAAALGPAARPLAQLRATLDPATGILAVAV